jgi:hypothetical protein
MQFSYILAIALKFRLQILPYKSLSFLTELLCAFFDGKFEVPRWAWEYVTTTNLVELLRSAAIRSSDDQIPVTAELYVFQNIDIVRAFQARGVNLLFRGNIESTASFKVALWRDVRLLRCIHLWFSMSSMAISPNRTLFNGGRGWKPARNGSFLCQRLMINGKLKIHVVCLLFLERTSASIFSAVTIRRFGTLDALTKTLPLRIRHWETVSMLLLKASLFVSNLHAMWLNASASLIHTMSNRTL